MKNSAILFIVLLLASCVPESKKNNIPEVTVADSSVVTRKIGKVRFYLETSASMAGYFKGGADFVKTIPNLLVDIEGKILGNRDSVLIYYIADELKPYPNSTQKFLRDISTTRVATSKSSEIHRIFETIAQNSEPDDISVFVSDCVLSFPDQDIRANSQINREMAAGALKADVKATFLKLGNQGKVAVMYGLTSPFYGTYYTYENKKLPLSGTSRPYYIWVIGDRSLVNDFNAGFRNFGDLKSGLSLDFGLFDPSATVSDYDVFFNYGRSGSWKLEGKNIANTGGKTPSVLTVALNLSQLPAHAQDLAFLSENLAINSPGAQIRIDEVQRMASIDKSGLKPNELKIAQHNTHAVTLTIESLFDQNATAALSLPLKHRIDYRQWSVMDDRIVDSLAGKTFAFEHLIDGVREAFDAPGENYLQISIPLTK